MHVGFYASGVRTLVFLLAVGRLHTDRRNADGWVDPATPDACPEKPALILDTSGSAAVVCQGARPHTNPRGK
jgi:hypothetical protein